jgi:hypothetical protein
MGACMTPCPEKPAAWMKLASCESKRIDYSPFDPIDRFLGEVDKWIVPGCLDHLPAARRSKHANEAALVVTFSAIVYHYWTPPRGRRFQLARELVLISA